MRSVIIIWAPLATLTITGLIVAFFRQGEYNWNFVLKFVIIGVLIGQVGELFALIQMTIKRKKTAVRMI